MDGERIIDSAQRIMAERMPCNYCPMYRQCLSDRLACLDFARYTGDSDRKEAGGLPTRLPLRAVYRWVFSPFDSIESGRTGKHGQPTYKPHPETDKHRRAAFAELKASVVGARA